MTSVVDGDTIRMTCSNGTASVRLTGFDTPETYQSGCIAERRLGEEAKSFLERHFRQAKVIAPIHKGTDKYNRILAEFIVDGEPLADTMVRKGYAVRYYGGKRIDWCSRLNA